jgi:hypothetical protein
MNSWRGVAVLGALLVACGGKGEQASPSDDGGAGSPASPSDDGGAGREPEPTGSSGANGADDPPKGPRAQGAARFTIRAVSPPLAGKACPSGAAFTSGIPAEESPVEALDADTYLHKVVDGEAGARVSCRVVETENGFVFDGEIAMNGRGLRVTNGVSAGTQGEAAIHLVETAYLPGALSSSAANCRIDVDRNNSAGLQIAAGSMWAAFQCPGVQSPPSDYCEASGFFVLENCATE